MPGAVWEADGIENRQDLSRFYPLDRSFSNFVSKSQKSLLIILLGSPTCRTDERRSSPSGAEGLRLSHFPPLQTPQKPLVRPHRTFFWYSLLLYTSFKPNYDNTKRRLKRQLPRIFVGYRCKLAGDQSLDPHVSKGQTSHVHGHREHETEDSSQLFGLGFYLKHMCVTTLHFKLNTPHIL